MQFTLWHPGLFLFRQVELILYQRGIIPAGRYQGGVCALLGYVAVAQHYDVVGIITQLYMHMMTR